MLLAVEEMVNLVFFLIASLDNLRKTFFLHFPLPPIYLTQSKAVAIPPNYPPPHHRNLLVIIE